MRQPGQSGCRFYLTVSQLKSLKSQEHAMPVEFIGGLFGANQF